MKNLVAFLSPAPVSLHLRRSLGGAASALRPRCHREERFVMKFVAKSLSVLAAAGLVMGATAALAAKKAPEQKNIFELIEADLKAIDKEIVKIFTPAK